MTGGLTHDSLPPARRGEAPRRSAGRGTILIVTMWVMFVLTSLVLMLAQSMRVEAVCSANEYSAMQAQAVEQGAVQYVLGHLDSLQGTVPTNLDTPCEAVRVGAGAFWIIRPNFDDEHSYAYGIVDEASKVHLNTASATMLSKLPDMTTELAASIVDWRSNTTSPSPGGAKNEYYMLLTDPYQCKNGPLETVEELFLIKGATSDLIFGEDVNRNGVRDANEVSGTVFDRGLFPYVTVYSVEPNTASSGQARININDAAAQQGLRDLLTKSVPAKASAIMARVPRLRPFRNVFDFYIRTGLTATEFQSVADLLTTSTQTPLRGLVNVNTAPAEVLACLPGLEIADVSALIAKRAQSGVDLSNLAWVAAALTPAKAMVIWDLITVRAYRFSADIVSVCGDGRAFRRCRIVVDSQKSPPKVIYRQDLTQLGWPLAPDIITKLRSGVSLDQLGPTNVVTEASR